MDQERRRFTRVSFSVKAEMQLNDVLYEVEKLLNLSVGGCLLSMKEEFDRGTPCIIRILLTGTNNELSIRVEGEVLRCGREGVAVKFTHIDPDSLYHLQSIILYNSSDPEDVEQELIKHPTPFQ